MATKYQKLQCTLGNHEWDWPVKRGRKPTSCPAHKAAPAAPKEPSTTAIDALVERVLKEQRERATYSCRCNFGTGLSWDKLARMGAGCSGPAYVCPTLDSVRRAVDRLR